MNREKTKTDNMQTVYNKGRSSDFIVRVKSGKGVAIQGKIEHIQTGQVQYFSDFLEMLMLVQGKLDEIGNPQRDTELRTF
jgi:hypothetical protein